MSKRLEAEATALLLTELLAIIPQPAFDALVGKWGEHSNGLLGAVMARMRADRAEQKARDTEAAEEEAEALRNWLEGVTGLRAKVRRATPRVIGVYARSTGPRAVVVSVRAVRPRHKGELGEICARVDVPLAEPWASRQCNGDPFLGTGRSSAAATLESAVGEALADADTRPEYRPFLAGVALRLRGQVVQP